MKILRFLCSNYISEQNYWNVSVSWGRKQGTYTILSGVAVRRVVKKEGGIHLDGLYLIALQMNCLGSYEGGREMHSIF